MNEYMRVINAKHLASNQIMNSYVHNPNQE